VAGAVAELPQLSDSDLEEEEGDDRDRCRLSSPGPSLRLDLCPASMHTQSYASPLALMNMERVKADDTLFFHQVDMHTVREGDVKHEHDQG